MPEGWIFGQYDPMERLNTAGIKIVQIKRNNRLVGNLIDCDREQRRLHRRGRKSTLFVKLSSPLIFGIDKNSDATNFRGSGPRLPKC